MRDMISLEPKPANKCKGIIFRCRISLYLTGGGYSEQMRMIPLKRQSCSGCDACGGMLEWLQENIMCGEAPIIDNPEDGAMYLLSGQGGGGPDYNGEYDSGEIVMREVKPKEKEDD